jgi:hypothetical protein
MHTQAMLLNTSPVEYSMPEQLRMQLTSLAFHVKLAMHRQLLAELVPLVFANREQFRAHDKVVVFQ